MKPFDLEAAKRGEPIITRDGRAVKFIAHVPEACESSRVAVFVGTMVSTRNERGLTFMQVENDLFMAPRKRTVWVNLYPGNHCGCWYYSSEADADNVASERRIGNRAYPIEIEE